MSKRPALNSTTSRTMSSYAFITLPTTCPLVGQAHDVEPVAQEEVEPVAQDEKGALRAHLPADRNRTDPG